MGSNAFALFISPPVSKDAPRAFCAIIILSISSIKEGINLKAILIIIATSWTGNFIHLRGVSRLSSPSVRFMGVVVSVIKEVESTRNNSLIAILEAKIRPCSVIVSFHHDHKTLPSE